MERWEAKVLSLAVCLVALFTAVALPIKVSQLFYSQGERGARWLDIVNCFGGGVFLGTYLLTFPQVRVLIEDALLKPQDIHYPLPELLVGVGFFLIMFLEKSISLYNSRNSSKVHKDSGDNIAAIGTELKQSDTVVTFVSEINDDYSNNIPQNDLSNGNGVHSNHLNNSNSHNNGDVVLSNGHSNLAFMHDDKNDISLDTKIESPKTPTANGSIVTSPGDVTSDEPDFASALKALILMAALAIDNVFIGMGLGLRDTNVGVWNMLITILSHELVISFTLGLALVKHNPTKKVLVLAAVYASMCPIGIGIGTILLDTGVVGEGVELVSGILQALAAGVFLYVTFFEILDGHVGHHSNIPCLISIFAGFSLMALLSLLEEETPEENAQMWHSHQVTSSPGDSLSSAFNVTTASMIREAP